MVLVFHHVIIFFLLSDWLIQILPPFWFCCDVACFCFGSETQLKCTYRRCCQFFKNIVLCLDALSGRESVSMATFLFMTLLLFSSILGQPTSNATLSRYSLPMTCVLAKRSLTWANLCCTSDVERTAVPVVHGYLGDPQSSLLWSDFIPCLALFGSPICITSGPTSGLGPLGWIADRGSRPWQRDTVTPWPRFVPFVLVFWSFWFGLLVFFRRFFNASNDYLLLK